jgi:ADP-ribose pyrophosphatase YjhB (NUDIX family)
MKKGNHYSSHDRFYLAVDCIIFGFDNENLNILLIRRNFDPMKNKWSLMGGFLDDNESVDQAASRVLHQLTGLKDVYLEQLYTYGDIRRDSEQRVVSVAYYALIRTLDYDTQLGLKHQAKWFDIREIPGLIFDHNEMVDKGLRRLRRKARSQPIGFELLPEKFTIPMLQRLYESIYQTQFDKRNFRKKIISMDILVKLDEKEKTGSKKGAWLYKFDEAKYLEKQNSGFLFEI